MSYLDQSEIGANVAMNNRVAQCAASEGITNPDEWTQAYKREWSAAPGWDAAWASAQASHPPDTDALNNYDPGKDEAVITDQMILSQVQSMPATQPT